MKVSIQDVIQISLLVVAIISLIIVYRQLRANDKTLRLNTNLARGQLFQLFTASVTDTDVETMLLHLPDHIKPEIFAKEYAGHPTRIKSYLLMRRKYIYILLSYDAEKNIQHAANVTSLWIKELCQYKEFLHVHESQKDYYPEFAKVVDKIIESTDKSGKETIKEKWIAESVRVFEERSGSTASNPSNSSKLVKAKEKKRR